MAHTILDQWAEWQRAVGYADRTVQTRISQVETLCQANELTDPTKVHLEHLVHWLSQCDKQWTKRTYYNSAHAWCGWLVEMGYRKDDPTSHLRRPKAPDGSPRPVPWPVIEAALARAPGRRARAYLTLAAFGGLRVSEVARTRGEDIDQPVGWLTIEGKGGQRAAVPLHPAIRQLSIGYPSYGWWFPARSGSGHVHPKTVSRRITETLRAVDYQSSAHAVRHAFATEILRTSHDARITQLLLRHRSLASTQLYVAVSDQALVDAINGLGWVA